MSNKELTKKERDLNGWYNELVTKSEMTMYDNISGCYALLPRAYSIWEHIKLNLDYKLKFMGVENVHFPMFVSKGNSVDKVNKNLTPETIIYPHLAIKVTSSDDLPIRWNQWNKNNMVKWENKNATPLLKTTDFLWQEGHTVYKNKSDAITDTFGIINLYEDIYENLLAVPVIKGYKSYNEKYSNAEYTMTVEAIIPYSSQSIQGATSHFLGQNFSKKYNIAIEEENVQSTLDFKTMRRIECKIQQIDQIIKLTKGDIRGIKDQLVFFKNNPDYARGAIPLKNRLDGFKKELSRLREMKSVEAEKLTSKKECVWQNSWEFTTKSIGIMIMTHSDNRGLVLPPKIAPIQVVLIPIPLTSDTPNREMTQTRIEQTLENIRKSLQDVNVRIFIDNRTNKTPGWKFNYHELGGVPIILELGINDISTESVTLVKRLNGEKTSVQIINLATSIPIMLNNIQQKMFTNAKETADADIKMATNWKNFGEAIRCGFQVLAPWCETPESEEWIKGMSKSFKTSLPNGSILSGSVKPLCIPFNQPPLDSDQMCFTGNGQKAVRWCLFGRSY